MIKAIFFDLDGTLLDSRKRIPESAVNAMKSCKERGIKLFAATARFSKSIEKLDLSEEAKNLLEGGVFGNGALNIVDGEEKYNFIDGEVIRRIVTVMREFPYINVSLQMKNNVHAFNNTLDKSELSEWGLADDEIFSTENVSNEEILKVMIFDGGYTTELKELPSEVINIMSNVCGKLAKLYITDFGKVLQVGSVTASKYNGIEYIRNQLNIGKDEVAVFGDDLNDIEMIKGYRNSVAMGNAVDEIKEAAGFVTETNDNDGIALAVKEFIFSNEF